MKKLNTIIFLLILINYNLSAQTLKEVWKSDQILMTPESAYFDDFRQQIYVSNVNGQPTDKDGNGFISILNKSGSVEKLKWVEGLNAPKGMAIFDGSIYVTDIDRIGIIDIEKGIISSFIEVPGAKFLNDMVVDDAGNIYISDMVTNQILMLKNGKIAVWLEDEALKSPNGLTIENGKLLVGSANQLLSIEPLSKKIDYLINETGGIDGLIPLGSGQYVISDWSGKVQLISIHSEPKVLQNTTQQKIQAADLGFISNEKIILIPTFFDNRVVGMKLIY